MWPLHGGFLVASKALVRANSAATPVPNASAWRPRSCMYKSLDASERVQNIGKVRDDRNQRTAPGRKWKEETVEGAVFCHATWVKLNSHKDIHIDSFWGKNQAVQSRCILWEQAQLAVDGNPHFGFRDNLSTLRQFIAIACEHDMEATLVTLKMKPGAKLTCLTNANDSAPSLSNRDGALGPCRSSTFIGGFDPNVDWDSIDDKFDATVTALDETFFDKPRDDINAAKVHLPGVAPFSDSLPAGWEAKTAVQKRGRGTERTERCGLVTNVVGRLGTQLSLTLTGFCTFRTAPPPSPTKNCTGAQASPRWTCPTPSPP